MRVQSNLLRLLFLALVLTGVGCVVEELSPEENLRSPVTAAMQDGFEAYREQVALALSDAAAAIEDGGIKDEKTLQAWLIEQTKEARQLAFQPAFDALDAYMRAARESEEDFTVYGPAALALLEAGCR